VSPSFSFYGAKVSLPEGDKVALLWNLEWNRS